MIHYFMKILHRKNLRKKQHSMVTSAQLLFMLRKYFFASTRPQSVHQKKKKTVTKEYSKLFALLREI